MKFDIKKSIDSTINYFKTGKRVIFPIEYKKLSNELETLRLKFIKKYKEKLWSLETFTNYLLSNARQEGILPMFPQKRDTKESRSIERLTFLFEPTTKITNSQNLIFANYLLHLFICHITEPKMTIRVYRLINYKIFTITTV